jgi:L-aspartate oxidase
VECLVVGSGVAGLRAAIEASRRCEVLVVAKDAFRETNTEYAQGGVAAVTSHEDSTEDHVADTLRVGQGLCAEDRVRTLVEEGPARVQELLEWGGNFDREGGRLALAMEGGHSRPRILRAGGDATGREIQRLLTHVAKNRPRIRFAEYTFLVDLLTEAEGRCVGALLWDQNQGLRVVWCKSLIVATGGVGMVFRETTNPSVATGDGIAAAFRAGVPIVDMEFMQFHPTTLYIAGAARNLISEAVRGEGAYLRDSAGERFMLKFHPRAELAPRDIVSRSILQWMKLRGDTNVYLDLTHLDGAAMRARFPGLAKLATSYGLDVSKDLIPVHPSAHYSIGGLVIDDHGRSPLEGLYACGEAAATLVHGANRLASNSLLECLVFSARAGEAAAEEAARRGAGRVDLTRTPSPDRRLDHVERGDMINSIRSLMWRCAGIERDGERLKQALDKLAFWSQYILRHPFPTPSGWELQNLLTVSYLIVTGAHARQESRGVHYRFDYPERDDAHWRCRLEVRNVDGGLVQVTRRPVVGRVEGSDGPAASAEGLAR